jgi:hypothetical protein
MRIKTFSHRGHRGHRGKTKKMKVSICGLCGFFVFLCDLRGYSFLQLKPAFGEKLKELGIEILPGGRKELDAFRSNERKRISELVKASGVEIK